MIDTHTHLYMPESYPGEEAGQAVERAIEAGVHTMVLPNVDRDSIDPINSLRAAYPDNLYVCMGLHPTEVFASWREDLDEIKQHLHLPGVVGIGEIGMDLHEDASMCELQKEAFREQMMWADHYQLPVAIHQRAALQETLEILKETLTDRVPAIVFHCFTEGPESVEAIRRVVPEALFGIGGVCTFKNAPYLRKALHTIGLNHIVLETDAPFLAPVPHRGKRNESAYIPLIAGAVAAELGISKEEVATVTTRNAYRLFPAIPH